jgi:serine/threonine protein kinase
MLSSAVTEQSTRYVRVAELGEGTFGRVSAVWDAKLLATRALKAFKPEEEGDVSECALREVAFQAFLTDVRAPNVLPLIDVLLGAGPEVCMLQPLMSRDLADFIEDGDYEDWNKAVSVMRDILEALRFLHGAGPSLVHRDLKPENVLLEPTGRAILTDLGFMRFTKDGPPYDSGPLCHGSNQRATRTYTAPEMTRHGVPHGPPVDIWAAGVIGVELFRKKRLNASTDKTARRHLQAFCERHEGDANVQVLRAMLTTDPAKRIDAASALGDAIFASSSMAPVAMDHWKLSGHEQPGAPPPPCLTSSEPRICESIAERVGKLMTELDFVSCQTFYAACAYATDASQWRGADPPSASEVALYSVLAAGKLYEHEFWDASSLAERLDLDDRAGFVRDFVAFQKLLLQNRNGRLLVPFPTTCAEFEKRVAPRRKRKRRKNRLGSAAAAVQQTIADPNDGAAAEEGCAEETAAGSLRENPGAPA